MALVPLIRLVALSLVSVFAVIVLGLTAGLTSLTETYLGGYFQFAALGIATASLTLLTVPAMIALEIIRPGGFTSQIIVELPWLSVLWVLWLATAADATNVANNIFIASCGDYFSDKIAQGCRETSAVQGLAYVTWVIRQCLQMK
ncbi:unnamed protein product [Mycena citricolor]|uniref:MARVEL domain-containing protein n=1 Tax=Mycena citricolor TaxID=2018698 RepID=A0AAD2HHY3_9AGAR|nr:unnamed protein product [Mycena citricolor]